jgi:hypothetical protein
MGIRLQWIFLGSRGFYRIACMLAMITLYSPPQREADIEFRVSDWVKVYWLAGGQGQNCRGLQTENKVYER